MTSATPKLDLERFRKVAALIKGGATDGERASAKDRATAMAVTAGLSLQEALAKLSEPTQPKHRSIFADLDDAMERQQPGYKAEQQATRDQREDRRLRRIDELRAKYGSLDAVMKPTPEEKCLQIAVAPFAIWGAYTTDDDVEVRYIAKLEGKDDYELSFEGQSERLRKALVSAVPLSDTIEGLLQEARRWEQLRLDRSAILDAEYYLPLELQARVNLVEHLLDTQPADSWDDLEHRFAWERWK